MLSFLENHDEVRFASSAFAGSVECHGAPAARSLTPAPLACAALLSDGPFMLYFGQEVGEDAFGHDNNRTSIFNFETPVAIRLLWEYIHNPHTVLSADQAELLALYRSILNLACGLDGTPMFDLCYCQREESGFDPRRHFAFLRGGTLVFCNFSLSEVSLDLEIPAAAAALNKVKENPVRVTCRAFGAYIKQLITN